MNLTTDPLGLLRADGDTFAVRFERTYPTPPEDLWDAVTRPERVARWLAPFDGDARVGGEVVLRFPDGGTTLRVTRCDPPRSLALDWVHARPGAAPSVVTAEVTAAADGGSRLVLEHSRLTRVGAPGHAAGWHYYLGALDAVQAAAAAPPTWDDAFDGLFARYHAALPETAAPDA
jgi:uncharacterized protein YndB with AHSA1/START domain